MNTSTRCLVFLAIAICLVVLLPSSEVSTARAYELYARQGTVTAPAPQPSSAPPPAPPTPSPSPPTQPTPSPPPVSNTPAPPTPPPSSNQPQQPPTSSAAPPPPPPTSAPTANAPATSAPPVSLPPQTSSIATTDAQGSTSFVIVTNSENSQASQTSSAAPSQSSSSSSSGGLGTGPIIGLSVAGGIAVLCLIGFFVWKFSKKRFNDFDDSEAIKWPELNTHSGEPDSHPLPVNNTGRAGFGNEDGSQSQADTYSNTYADSTPDFNSADPYAVPPLPHLNPNQPYRDDPNADTYYDPYRGPVPNAINDPGRYTPDAIPMTQMAPAGRRSPGPQMAYESGRASPKPSLGGRVSPGPQAALYGQGYDTRTKSPGPMGYVSPERRPSPGPGAAYGGRQSPGPQNAYR